MVCYNIYNAAKIRNQLVAVRKQKSIIFNLLSYVLLLISVPGLIELTYIFQCFNNVKIQSAIVSPASEWHFFCKNAIAEIQNVLLK